MKFNLIILTIFVLIAAGIFFLKLSPKNIQSPTPIPTPTTLPLSTGTDAEKTTIIAANLDTPWAIVFLPDGSMLVSERPGRVRLIGSNGQLQEAPVAVIDKVKEIGEGGLLGMTLHPDFSSNNYVYLYFTYQGSDRGTRNRVIRMKYQDNKLTDEKIIVDNIPGASNHNGGRIKFGPDNYLYITTGDAQNPSQAQDKNSLAGKILRVTQEGQPAPGNPFNNLVYSYGHRNAQGLAWDSQGRLWATEHGRSGLQSGLDELNIIEPGKNYGWPDIQGDEFKKDMVTPVAHSGSDTWAPSGLAYLGNSLYFGGLRGSALYEFNINKQKLTEHFKNEFGRIRDVVVGPDNMLYVTTSNRDGRGNPASDDDKIIRVNPSLLP